MRVQAADLLLLHNLHNLTGGRGLGQGQTNESSLYSKMGQWAESWNGPLTRESDHQCNSQIYYFFIIWQVGLGQGQTNESSLYSKSWNWPDNHYQSSSLGTK